MATITGNFAIYGTWEVTITGVLHDATSPTFIGRGFPFSSFGLDLTGTAPTGVQWQGSNDGGNNWDNIGLSIVPPIGGTLTPGAVNYKLYQFVVTGGDATTSISAYVTFTKSQ